MAKHKYLLDTNVCISMLKDKYNIRSKIEEIGTVNCCVSEITDLLIGCSSIQNKMVMVTANTKHFERMDGITLENWEHNRL